MATLSIANLLDQVVGREDTVTTINQLVPVTSAVGQILSAAGNPIRRTNSKTFAYSTLTDPTFSTWDNTSAKTSQSLAGAVGEVSMSTAYAIVAYPLNYEDDLAAFAQMFAQGMANGFAKYIDDRVLNTASIGVIPLASGVSNTLAHTTASPTTYQLRTDLVSTIGLVTADGFRVNGIVGELAQEAEILNAVGSNGQPVFTEDVQGNINRLLGKPYASTAINLANGAEFVVGDWSKVTVAIAQDLKFERNTTGIVNIDGTEYNLFERNMVAIRAEARMAFVVTQAAAFAYLY